jgi:Fe-S cluster assembly scaffold protein SufB
MTLEFDTITVQDWKTRWIREVFVSFVLQGCEGTKIHVSEQRIWETETVLEITERGVSTGLMAHVSEQDKQRLKWGRITHAKGKWIFTSPLVQSRCWCGSSFSFEDKVQALGFALQQRLESGELACIQPSEDEHPVLLQTGSYGVFSQKKQHFQIAPHAQVTLYEFVFQNSDSLPSQTEIELLEWSSLSQRICAIGAPNQTLSHTVTARISGNAAKADVRLTGLALDRAHVHLDGIGIVHANVQWACIRVHESQIFLGESGSFQGKPSLEIASHDVEAAHSLTTQRLSEATQAFLTSRGLSESQARSMMLAAEVKNLLAWLPEATLDYLADTLIQIAQPKHVH